MFSIESVKLKLFHVIEAFEVLIFLVYFFFEIFEMSKRELASYAHRLLNKIAKEHGFRNYTIQEVCVSQPGESVAGEIFRILISETKNDKRLQLVCKVPPFDKQLFNELNLSVAFEREILFYSQLMPAFVKFQKEKNLQENEQFRCYPKCYGTWMDGEKEEYAIVLEDLRPRGFKKVEKSKLLQSEQLHLAMIELGKFHGLSFAMKDQKPNEFCEYQKLTDLSITLCQSLSMQTAFENAFDRAIDSLKNEEHKNIMRHVKGHFLLYSMDCFDAKCSDSFKVVGHGKQTSFHVTFVELISFNFMNNFMICIAGDFWHDNILYRLNQSVSKSYSWLNMEQSKNFKYSVHLI